MLRTKSLCFEYNQKNAFLFPDIELVRGENLLVLGESGIGKTTLLHLLAGLLKPKLGSIEIDNTFVNKMSSSQMDKYRGENIGLVFQHPHFVQSLTLKKNITLAQYLGTKTIDEQRAHHLLDSLGLMKKLNSKPNNLSQGEKQRAAIAMAVANNPKLILADEPTSSLDNKNCEKVVHLLKQQASDSDANLLVITHDQRLKEHFQKTLEL